jgi:amidohydrolase
MFSHQILDTLRTRIGQHRGRILAAEAFIWQNPETGYREAKTSAYMAERFAELGYAPVFMGGIPGFYADLDTGRPGPALALLGELDAVLCAAHPAADPATGAVHACGHHTQSAALLGAAAALRAPDLLSQLCGKIRFVAVPAEEMIELAYRASLREQGTIRYFGGKVEFLHRGVFDGVDAAAMLHAGCDIGEKAIEVYKGNNGCLAKNITFYGKASHAGVEPWEGVNALYAASLGLQAINAIRETFREENVTRVHPIITDGGSAVNVIPEAVRLESFVRGATPGAMVSENMKVNRALAGAALSLGARLRVSDTPGYMPLHNDAALNELAAQVGAALFGQEAVVDSGRWGGGSTDMGDLSCVLPVVHPWGGGGRGIIHGDEFTVADSERASVGGARFLAGMAVALLQDGGAELRTAKAGFTPLFASYQDYFNFIDAMAQDRELVAYEGSGAAVYY